MNPVSAALPFIIDSLQSSLPKASLQLCIMTIFILFLFVLFFVTLILFENKCFIALINNEWMQKFRVYMYVREKI